MEYSTLVWSREPVQVAFLADGTRTLDIERARADVERARAAVGWTEARLTEVERRARIEVLGSVRPARRPSERRALLRSVARTLAGTGQPTPARAEIVRELVRGARLTEEDADAVVVDGHVSDEAWAVIQQLRSSNSSAEDPDLGAVLPPRPRQPSGELRTEAMSLWRAELQSAAGIISVGVDPLELDGVDPPLSAITAVLDRLAGEGWELLHVSEDRAVDDAATRSRVVAVRYLLARES